MASSSSNVFLNYTIEDFMANGMSYEDAVAAFHAQQQSSPFGWFREAVGASSYGTPVPPDPDLERALRAQREFMSSQQSLLGRYTPAQLAAYGLSSQFSTPFGGSPYVQSVPPTAPPSSLPSQRPSPLSSQRPSPLSSHRSTPNPSPHPSPRPYDRSEERRRSSSQQQGGTHGSSSGSRRGSRGSRGSGSCCFGGGGTNSPPVSPLPTPAESEDHDIPPADAHGLYYHVHRGGDVDLGTVAGRRFWTHLNNLIHSTYQDCFISFKKQDPDHLNYIETCMHMRFPNPPGQEFSRQWLEEHVKQFLKNKKSSTRRAALKQVEDPVHNHRPGQIHDQEWEKAMAEKEVERVAGTRAHAQQRDARARQTPTHYGSGGKAAWKDKYVSITC